MGNIDFLIFGLVIFFLIFDLICLFNFFVENLAVFNGSEDSILNMSNNTGSGFTGNQGCLSPNINNSMTPNNQNPTGLPSGHTTNVSIIHDDGSWSNGIIILFVYGVGGTRL